jgi:hypothetical protein
MRERDGPFRVFVRPRVPVSARAASSPTRSSSRRTTERRPVLSEPGFRALTPRAIHQVNRRRAPGHTYHCHHGGPHDLSSSQRAAVQRRPGGGRRVPPRPRRHDLLTRRGPMTASPLRSKDEHSDGGAYHHKRRHSDDELGEPRTGLALHQLLIRRGGEDADQQERRE